MNNDTIEEYKRSNGKKCIFKSKVSIGIWQYQQMKKNVSTIRLSWVERFMFTKSSQSQPT